MDKLMGFLWKRKKKQLVLSKDEHLLKELYDVLNNHGDDILSGKTTLTLTSPVLILLNGSFQNLTDGVNESCFQVAGIDNESKKTELLTFIFDFVQKVLSLKLVSGAVSLDCPLLSLNYFKSIQHLEIWKIPIQYVRNLHIARRELQRLTCCRSTSSIDAVIQQFGKDSPELYILPVLKYLNLGYNKITTLNDETMKLLPALEYLDVSYNCIRDASSQHFPALSNLNLGFNMISKIPEFPSKLHKVLNTLVLRNNKLVSLKGIDVLTNLKYLDVTSNCLSKFSEIVSLAMLEKLINLSLKNNPIYYVKEYRRLVIQKLSPAKRIEKIFLDGKELDVYELGSLGHDVEPVSLSAYIPSEPNSLTILSINKIASLQNTPLVCKDSQDSSKINQSKRKSKRKIHRIVDISDSESIDLMNSPVSSDNKYYENFSGGSSFGFDHQDFQTISNPVSLISPSEGSSSNYEEENISWKHLPASLNNLEETMNKTSKKLSDELNVSDSEISVVSFKPEYEYSYLVKNVLHNKDDFVEPDTEYLFVSINPPYLLEKTDDGNLRNRFELASLIEQKKNAENPYVIELQFDSQILDCQWRKYIFEQPEQVDVFYSVIESIALSNEGKLFSDVNSCECLKCGNSFTRLSDRHVCDICGSNMVINKYQSTKKVLSESAAKVVSQVDSSIAVIQTCNGPNAPSSWPPTGGVYRSKEDTIVPKDFLSKSKIEIREQNSNSSLEKIISKTSANGFESLLVSINDTKNLSTVAGSMFDNSVILEDSTGFPKEDKRISTPFKSLKGGALVEYGEFLKCNHRLKLYLSLNVYEENEEFLCQLRCGCAMYDVIKVYEDVILNLSNAAVYIFQVSNCKSDIPENNLKKLAFLPIPTLKSIRFGYFRQSFTMEFSKPNCYFKFLVGDSKRVDDFINLLKDQLNEAKVAPSFEYVQEDTHLQTITNIRCQVFGISEDILSKGKRIYNQMMNYEGQSLLKTRKMRLRNFQQCFIGKEFVDWAVNRLEAESRTEMSTIAQQLLDEGIIYDILKHQKFEDNDSWYKFTPTVTNESVTAADMLDIDSDVISEREESEDIDCNICVYLYCRLRNIETDSSFHSTTLISTNSHLFVTRESHQWPLPICYPPPTALRTHYTVKEKSKISSLSSVTFYEDAPCYLTLNFIDDDENIENEEKSWMIQTETIRELDKLYSFIELAWESLFAIKIRKDTVPYIELTLSIDSCE